MLGDAALIAVQHESCCASSAGRASSEGGIQVLLERAPSAGRPLVQPSAPRWSCLRPQTGPLGPGPNALDAQQGVIGAAAAEDVVAAAAAAGAGAGAAAAAVGAALVAAAAAAAAAEPAPLPAAVAAAAAAGAPPAAAGSSALDVEAQL